MRRIERLIPPRLKKPEGTKRILISVKEDEDLEKLHQFLMIEGKLRGLRIRSSSMGRRKIDLVVNGGEKKRLLDFLDGADWIRVHKRIDF